MLLAEREIFAAPFLRHAHRQNSIEWTNCYVKNIPSDWDEEKLRSVFEPCGGVESVVLRRGPEDSHGFGFVTMLTHEAAVSAIETINGINVMTLEKPAPEQGGEGVNHRYMFTLVTPRHRCC
jgi:polyadenylate-binding protein